MKRSGPDHPKVKHLASLLNINEAWAIGLLELLWHFTGKYAPQGDIGKYSDEVIAHAVKWDRPSGRTAVKPQWRLSGALVEAQWLDTCPCHRYVVHDWKDHADEAVKKFLSRHSLDFVHTESRLPLPEPMPLPLPAAASAAFAAAAPPPARPLANGNDPIQIAFAELAAEGRPLPARYLTNEFGREERNPASERLDAAIRRAEPRILAARMPVAFAKKVILDALKGA